MNQDLYGPQHPILRGTGLKVTLAQGLPVYVFIFLWGSFGSNAQPSSCNASSILIKARHSASMLGLMLGKPPDPEEFVCHLEPVFWLTGILILCVQEIQELPSWPHPFGAGLGA